MTGFLNKALSLGPPVRPGVQEPPTHPLAPIHLPFTSRAFLGRGTEEQTDGDLGVLQSLVSPGFQFSCLWLLQFKSCLPLRQEGPTGPWVAVSRQEPSWLQALAFPQVPVFPQLPPEMHPEIVKAKSWGGMGRQPVLLSPSRHCFCQDCTKPWWWSSLPVSSLAESHTGKGQSLGRCLPGGLQPHLSLHLAPISPPGAGYIGIHVGVRGKGSLLRIRAESMLLMAQPGIALLLQATVGHWVTVGFNTPPAGPRTPGTEPGTEPCREDTGLRGSGRLLRGPGWGWAGWGAGAGAACCCCCCNFFLLIFLSFALRFWNQIFTWTWKGAENRRW